MKPVIGICVNYEEKENKFSLREDYVLSIFRTGGVPVLLPPVEDDVLVERYYLLCDGFLLSGGGDLDPIYWGEQAEPMLGEINPLRDRFEMVLAKRLLRGQKPVLGICRGCQLINVAAGGSVIQHIQSAQSHDQKAPRYYPFHDIVIESGNILSNITGTECIRVNSFHHQAVGEPGKGFRVSARSRDGVIEAVEGESGWLLGVQWHPECMRDVHALNLFKAFIDKSKHL
ncbi:MAG: gamma-glutamyl-gamma-aminobutyrate hydrolase family protein [Bacillota bacterium]|nr:gamma-glutamyl-gamma-aminobutyrate hydrolase family protein [Bacillota bacterium]